MENVNVWIKRKGSGKVVLKKVQETYKKQAILTASAVEIEIMLLQESILYLKKAKLTEDRFERNEYFKRAQQFLLEAIPFFNKENKEAEMAVLLYYQVNKLLIKANIESNEDAFEEAVSILTKLIKAWQENKEK